MYALERCPGLVPGARFSLGLQERLRELEARMGERRADVSVLRQKPETPPRKGDPGAPLLLHTQEGFQVLGFRVKS